MNKWQTYICSHVLQKRSKWNATITSVWVGVEVAEGAVQVGVAVVGGAVVAVGVGGVVVVEDAVQGGATPGTTATTTTTGAGGRTRTHHTLSRCTTARHATVAWTAWTP